MSCVFVESLISLCVDGCHCVHFHLPYKWEVFDGVTWTELQHIEDIERGFCDPSKTQRSEVTSHFCSGLKIICCWWGADWNVSFLCFQLRWSARRLPDDESGVAACSPPLHSFLSNKATSLHPDDSVAVVLQGWPGELGGVWTAGESDCWGKFSCSSVED